MHKSNVCVASNYTAKQEIAILILMSFYLHFICNFILFRFFFLTFKKPVLKFVTVFIGVDSCKMRESMLNFCSGRAERKVSKQ